MRKEGAREGVVLDVCWKGPGKSLCVKNEI